MIEFRYSWGTFYYQLAKKCRRKEFRPVYDTLHGPKLNFQKQSWIFWASCLIFSLSKFICVWYRTCVANIGHMWGIFVAHNINVTYIVLPTNGTRVICICLYIQYSYAQNCQIFYHISNSIFSYESHVHIRTWLL